MSINIQKSIQMVILVLGMFLIVVLGAFIYFHTRWNVPATLYIPVYVGSVGMFLGLIFSLFIQKIIVQKIKNLVFFAEMVATGDFSQRIYTDTKVNELDKLAESFNKVVVYADELTQDLEAKVAKGIAAIEENKNKGSLLEVEKFKQVVENIQSGVVIINNNHNIVYANEVMTSLTGYTHEELIGRNPNIYKSKKTEEEIYNQQKTAINKGEAFSTENVFNKKKDGSIYNAEVSLYPISGENGVQFFVEMHTDITARKRAELARTEFVSIAGHQLRTPLSAIRWFLEDMLENPGNMSMTQSEGVAGLYKTSLRMIDLVNAMLDTSRLEVGTMVQAHEEVHIIDIIDETLTEQKLTAHNQDVSVIMDIPNKASIPIMMSDRRLLQMIVENLLSNAIKYTPPGGEIIVSVVNITTELFGERSFKTPGVGLMVKDNGIGIPNEQIHRVFEKMFRADNARTIETVGTGLGLYTIKLIIEEMHGSIWFDSKEGQGTIFYVYLPYAQEIGDMGKTLS